MYGHPYSDCDNPQAIKENQMSDEIDTSNKYMVGMQGNGIAIMFPPRGPIHRDEALTLAAWLVALADHGGQFGKILEAVQNT